MEDGVQRVRVRTTERTTHVPGGPSATGLNMPKGTWPDSEPPSASSTIVASPGAPSTVAENALGQTGAAVVRKIGGEESGSDVGQRDVGRRREREHALKEVGHPAMLEGTCSRPQLL